MLYFLILFILLTILIYSVSTRLSFIGTIDTQILEFFHTIQNKTFDLFFSFITWFGSLWILLPLFLGVLFILIKNQLYSLSLSISIGFLGALATTYSLKYILDKQRPHLYDTIGQLPPDPSFPSAHTTQIVIFSLLILLLAFYLQFHLKIFIATLAISSIVLVATSRIYLQVHYFSDILAGAIIGILWTMISYYLIHKQGVL
jgi:undecaprenyl-diphosphatase